MRHFAVHRDFELQAAVVRGNDLVGKACGNHQVRPGQPVLEQPGGPELATEVLVVGKQEFHRALQWQAQRLQRKHGKCVGGKVAFADRCRASVYFALVDLAAIRVVHPALAGRDHVAVRIERDRAPRCIAPANNQIGDRLQARRLHQRLGHVMLFAWQAHGVQQRGGATRVRCIVARRRVGGHLYQALQKLQLRVEVGVYPGVKLFVVGHGAAC